MLRFRSSLIRLTRTFVMGIPLLLGISTETQKLSVQMLKYKEGYPRTEAIRITMIPRAGTLAVPQIYEAGIVVNSQLPWIKSLVHNWRWTFYVWTSLYIYVMFLIVLVWFFRPLIFPIALMSMGDRSERVARETPAALRADRRGRVEEDTEVSEFLRKWRSQRGKRKAVGLERTLREDEEGSAASSISLTREDTSGAAEEETGDSESVYMGMGR